METKNYIRIICDRRKKLMSFYFVIVPKSILLIIRLHACCALGEPLNCSNSRSRSEYSRCTPCKPCQPLSVFLIAPVSPGDRKRHLGKHYQICSQTNFSLGF